MVLNSSKILDAFISVKMDMAKNLSKTIISVTQTPIPTDRTLSSSEEESDKGRDVVIASAIVILCAIIMICAMLCYREISRRRMEADMFDEYLRKEEIKRAIKKKIAQMQSLEDSNSYMEEMKLKVPLVTFGDVTRISPAQSFEALHLQAHHHHHYHHHHHHHHHLHSKRVLVQKSKNKNLSVVSGGKEKHWYSSPHKIPTKGRLLSFLFGNEKKRKEEVPKRNEVMYLEMTHNPTQDNQSSSG